ncbi:DUF5071 domain-containing protein [Mesorhizobium amorphae]|uniref:DUF5071 domain-containing protein n=1 Tax=Mesorhizobium amorphae CCNWGS0123 TaxID=1082933 RepID=G6YIT7_9HYPH|nr:DUF5071 domain-containing protein [Mesorhizobium amorphae]ANT51187.1 hypothetical protein A6B35_15305 [Mesorhizobium amorphae CCNWGS0123]EHH05892.1 hypothetical protein MEA186_29562 [Mesorhizobium amorphae CCNWGS0123]GLR42613.1 hypothetical protein GCM10007880_31290 [Mesorhizobium amorphae]
MNSFEQNLADLVPVDKLDTDKASALTALGYPAIEPILPQLLEWLQDINWPVAQVLQPLLAGIGPPLAPHLRQILRGNDDIWIYWILVSVVAYSPALAGCLTDELEHLAANGSAKEGVRNAARDILNGNYREPA